MKFPELWPGLLFVTVSALPIPSQSKWERLVSGDRLLSPQILAVAVDENNVTWIGTQRGVSRLENGELTHFTTWDGLEGSEIRDITVDKENVKWFATNGGISSFDGQNWMGFGEADGLVWNEVTSVAIDSDNVKWFGTKNGLSRFDGFTWTSFTVSDGLPSNRINQVAVGPEGDVWVATDEGAGRYDGESWENYNRGDGLASNFVKSVAIDQHGVVWCGTRRGLSVFDGKYWDSFEHQDGVWLTGVTTVFIDPANEVWIAATLADHWGSDDTYGILYNRTKFTIFMEHPGTNITFAADANGSILAGVYNWDKPALFRSTFRVDGSPESLRYRNEEPWFLRKSDNPGTLSRRVLLEREPGPLNRILVRSLSDGRFLLDVGGQLLVNADASGNVLWTKTLEDVHVVEIEEAPESGFTVLAKSSSSDSLKIYRFGQDGKLVWSRQLQLPSSVWDVKGGDVFTEGFISLENGHYLVLVSTYNSECCSIWDGMGAALIVFDSSGVALFDRKVASSFMRAKGLLPGPDENSVIFGIQSKDRPSWGCMSCYYDFKRAFLKMASVEGGEIWHYDSPVRDEAYPINIGTNAIKTTNGMYLLMDDFGSPHPGRFLRDRILLAMLDNEGEISWERILRRSGFDTIGIDLAPYPGGGAILLGTFDDGKLWMSHVDAEGRVVENWDLGETEDGYRPRIGTTPEGDIKVFGYRADTGVLDVREIVLATNVGTDRFNERLPLKMELFQNYPNPFNEFTTIPFSVANQGLVSLKVFNLHGAIVSELTKSVLPAGNYTVSFDAENLASGLYFCKLESGGKAISRKMLLLR